MIVISFIVLVVNGHLHFQNLIGVALLFCSYVGMWSKQLDHSFCWLTNKRFISILLQNFKNYTATV